jgi:hypothetical protein
MATHKGPASLRPRCTQSGKSVAAIPSTKIAVYCSINLVGVERGNSISRCLVICNICVVDLTLMHSYVEAMEAGLW